MKRMMMVLGLIVFTACTSVAWADPLQVTIPCIINHDNWPPFSDAQWEYRSCSAALPALAPYGVVEVTFTPITQVAPIGHPGWEAGCQYATPTWSNAPAGVAVTTTTDGTAIRAMAINLRATASTTGPLTIGVHCQ